MCVATKAFIDSGSDRCLMRKTFSTQFCTAEECEINVKGFVGGAYICKWKLIENDLHLPKAAN